MGRTHSNAYKRVNDFFDLPYRPVLKAICGRTAEGAKAFAENWGYESIETDWRKLVERKDIDAIDICTPNNTHAEIALAAAAAGKMILCEKPLAMNMVEGQKMVDAVEKAGVANTVWYNYRRIPAVTLAKQLIDEGRLGRIFHYRANFLQDWTISADLPQGGTGLWRLDVAAAGSGVTGDLLAHCIDTALWLNGPIGSVCAMTETFVKERKHNLTGKVEPVGIDDACAFLCRFGNGSLGLFESTRYARGHKALYTFEVNGEKASLKWDLHDLHRLEYFDHRRRLDHSRLALGARHRRRHAVHEELVGARLADRLRAHVRASGRRLPGKPGQGRADRADLQGRPGHAGRLRRRARLGRSPEVGIGRAGVVTAYLFHSIVRRLSVARGTAIHENRHESSIVDHSRHRAARCDSRPDQGAGL